MRRLGRPARPAPAFPPDPPAIQLPEEDDPRNGDSTEIALPSVGKPAPVREVPIESAVDASSGEAVPPSRLEFHCPCGAKLTATSKTYDKHSRCAMCQTELLLNLVYDPESGTHEVVPFRLDPNSPL